MNDSRSPRSWPRSPFLAALALAAALAAPHAGAQQPTAKPDPLAASGERLFVRNCAVCHGRSATGDGPFRSLLTVPPTDLTTIAARRGGTFPDDEIAAYVDGRFVPKAHGTREMPIWGRWLGQPLAPGVQPDEVTRGEILAIVTYLKTLQH